MSLLLARISPAERRRADEFASLLDGSRTPEGHELGLLVALAASLRPALLLDSSTAPRADFRAALRERLLAEAAGPVPGVPAQRSAPDPGPPRHRVRRFLATGVTVGLVAGAGTAAASTHAVPGDSLYGVKRGIEAVSLRLAGSDLSRGRELLEQADHRLSEAEALAAGPDARSPATRARIAGALRDMDTAGRLAAQELGAAYATSGDTEPLVVLDRFVVDQRQRLDDLSTLLDPRLQRDLVTLTDLLARLQTRLDTLLASAGTPASTRSGDAAAGEAVDGLVDDAAEAGGSWAVSRMVVNRLAQAGQPVAGNPTNPGIAADLSGDAASGPASGDPLAGVGGSLRAGGGSAASQGPSDGGTSGTTSAAGGGITGGTGTASGPAAVPVATPLPSLPSLPPASSGPLPEPLPTASIPLGAEPLPTNLPRRLLAPEVSAPSTTCVPTAVTSC